jgi:hypothetical protein
MDRAETLRRLRNCGLELPRDRSAEGLASLRTVLEKTFEDAEISSFAGGLRLVRTRGQERRVAPSDLARLRPRSAPDAPVPVDGRVLYLDLETTGLAAGPGTLAFLAGVAEARGDRLELTQLLLTGPETEVAALEALRALVAGAAWVVTFNGTTADLPILRHRAILQRVADPLAGVAHLDLMSLTRRLCQHAPGPHALVDLEQRWLGAARAGDVDGAEAPERWRRYLLDGEGAGLADVVAHNARDVLALPDLAAYLSTALDAGRGARPGSAAEWAGRHTAWAYLGQDRAAERAGLRALAAAAGDVSLALRVARSLLRQAGKGGGPRARIAMARRLGSRSGVEAVVGWLAVADQLGRSRPARAAAALDRALALIAEWPGSAEVLGAERVERVRRRAVRLRRLARSLRARQLAFRFD